MPTVPNTFRRGASIWWRRTMRLAGPVNAPITLSLSLLTKELSIARGRSAAMTAHSEKVRMSLYRRIAQEGLAFEQQKQLFGDEMRNYRDALEHEVARWQADPQLRDISDPARDLQMFETLWSAFARTGVVEDPSWNYAEAFFLGLDEEEQSRLRFLVKGTPGFAAGIRTEAADALGRVGLASNDTNMPLAIKLLIEARAFAAHACRTGMLPEAIADALATLPAAGTPVSAPPSMPFQARPVAPIKPVPFGSALTLQEDQVPEPWRHLTPTQVADRFIADTPKMFEHRQGGKRAAVQTGEQTLRQIRWAALLLEKSLAPGTPYWRVTFEDVKTFDAWLDRLPVTCGKSPWDRAPATTLAQIVSKAEEKIEKGEIAGDEIGLTPLTSNKHYRKLAQAHGFLMSNVPGLPALNFNAFTQPDRKDERTARLRYTLEQGKAIFSLPPWTGSAGFHDRLSAGTIIIHDSLFYVLILVWYTGARREELCKLRIIDVDCIDGIWFLRIEDTDTGRVKNVSAIRCIPLADEIVRLGFVHYVHALKDAGETLVFPDLEPADGTKRKRGDVFYKLWWIYLRPLVPGLLRGQAMHAARHTVSDELKQLEIFLEFRNDLLGHKSRGGEGATRYPSPAALNKVLDIVNRIPVVTSHLSGVCASGINLLLPEHRCQRPSRKKGLGDI